MQTTDAIPQPDLGLAVAKSFSPGLAVIVGHVRSEAVGRLSQQDAAALALDASQQQLNDMADEISCLKKGKVFLKSTPTSDIDRCGTDLANDAGYDQLRSQIVKDSAPEQLKRLPEADLKALDSEIAAMYAMCWTLVGTSTGDPNPCFSTTEGYQKDQYELDKELATLQARQTALVATRAALDALPDAGDFIDDVESAPDHKATIKIAAKDALTGTSTDLATVVITWQGTNFSISAGILLSDLPNRAFTNTPIIIGGVPSKDSSGKVLTMVTESDTKPSVVTPLAFFNYELPWLTANKGRFGVLLSGGLGANLSAKSADYAAGISFRYREVLFTPAVHLGRENELTNGVVVGQQLGSSPPTLPTEMHFRPSVGFALTYRIPIP